MCGAVAFEMTAIKHKSHKKGTYQHITNPGDTDVFFAFFFFTRCKQQQMNKQCNNI